MTTTDELLSCRAHVLSALRNAAARPDDLSVGRGDWRGSERLTVAVAANTWAQAHGYRMITVDQVYAVEDMAQGHSDYHEQLAWYVTELVVLRHHAQEPAPSE